MTAYLIGTIDVQDEQQYNLYKSFNPALVAAAGGKYIVKGKPIKVLEGDDLRSRFVMIEFANEAALRRFYDSPEYQALSPIRHGSAQSTIAIVNTEDETSEKTAYQIERFGNDVTPSSVTSAMAELGPLDIRIQPTLIALNPIDWKIRAGVLAALPFQFPHTLGCEGVGVVEEVGAEVKGFEPGQRVLAHSSLLRGGWFANKVDVSADQCALVPAEMSDEKAAAISTALLTAHQSISLHSGNINRALVIGASGAVGTIATALLAKGAGSVDAICSASNSEYVSTLGAAVQSPESAAKNQYDFVLDAAGGPTIEAGYQSLAKGGTLVSIVQPVDAERAQAKGATAVRYSVKPDGQQLKELLANHEGIPEPRIAAVLPLSEVNTAMQMAQHGRLRGKILLKP